jgi:hypothetical protein
VPFTFCGLMLGLLLSARQFPTRRVYVFDLAGSAVGAFAVLPAITHLGVEGGLLLAGGAMLLGTLLLAPPRGKVPRVVAALAGLALLGATGARETVFDLNYPKGSMAARTLIPSTDFVWAERVSNEAASPRRVMTSKYRSPLGG